MHNMKFLICFLLTGGLMTSSSISQTINKLTSKEKRNGWVLLFDGQSSKGWTTTSGKSVPKGWEIKSGLQTTTLPVRSMMYCRPWNQKRE